MLDSRKQAEVEQSITGMCELMPPFWRQLYLKLIKEEFTEIQSLELVKCFILSQGIAPCKP